MAAPFPPPSTSAYALGTFVGGGWRQWANAAGEDYYERVDTGSTQFAIPAGWEDVAAVCIC
ncbi:uncharacterized protein BDZ99DRAFT_467825 [Mytilinidion resinicola]|uniref:WW domain-containing protein n=1 Tax=Mytilinidion resinicola TaxID=574789 RepID=A0A6A6Y667_9PEZI|nr:uncharacterized protein BDZ99DRAFT_467825 [Mytilinidion resinicola]KAF2803695.1 hypothetical protein BDZ99DRAFT_467825 [Mytilinidion resinicola]